MIKRRRRPLARTQFETELRNGKRDGMHAPYLVAVRDFILHRHNHNPYREGTDDHALYENGFSKMVEEFVNTWNQANAHNEDNSPNGSRTT